MQGRWEAAGNMLGAVAKSPWDSEEEPFASADMRFRKAVGMLSTVKKTRMETLALCKQSLETPSGSGDEPQCARKGEVRR